MKKKEFDIDYWLTNSDNADNVSKKNERNMLPALSVASTTTEQDVELITQRIEAAAIDITKPYCNWVNVGFALAEGLGETGRSYFHRLSRFYQNYTREEADKQYDKCLNSDGEGITIKTLFHLAKENGVTIATRNKVGNAVENSFSPISSISPQGGKRNSSIKKSNESSTIEEERENNDEKKSIPADSPIEENGEKEELGCTPTFSQEIAHKLPPLLSRIACFANSPENADILLLGALTVFSSCLPNVSGIYNRREVFPNLFLFVTAQASAGKGDLTLCRHLINPIHDNLRKIHAEEMEEYRRLLKEYAHDKKNNEPPQEPPIKTLYLPANSSATAVYEALNANNGIGIIFETEGDTLSNSFKNDHGDFSDGFRKAFHHEKISYLRRKEHEFVEIPCPKLSAVLSGTPRQILSLIPDAENGLLSRFIFYYMNVILEWVDVFANDEEPSDSFFESMGWEFFGLYKRLQSSEPIKFAFSSSQKNQFSAFFSKVQKDYVNVFGTDIVASVRRLGIITFRIAMILTTLRANESRDLPKTLVCSDEDFQSAITMAQVLLQHTAKIFHLLFKSNNEKQHLGGCDLKRQQFFDNLPQMFNRQDYLDVAQRLGIAPKTAEKYIAKLCEQGKLKHTAQGKYEKA